MMSSILKTIAHKQKLLANCILKPYSTNGIPKLETLAVSVPKPHVYHVELNRPEKLNAFNYPMWVEFQTCFSALSDNPECRVIVLSARGKHFTAGIDLQSLLVMNEKASDYDDVARKARYLYKSIELYQDGITSLEKCVKPILSVTHSACIGAGMDLITAADIRYCTEDSWFQVKEADVGLAADVGTLQRLPKVIGNVSLARELCLTARKFDAAEAKEMGLVSNVLPDKESALNHVLDLAGNIAAKSPVAVQNTKINMVYSQDRTNQEGLLHIRLMNQACLQSEDLVKSAMAQVTKSGPAEFDNY